MAETSLDLSGVVAGKLMLGGEYAIVTGQAPAVAVAAGELLRWRLIDEGRPALTMTAFDKRASHPLDALEGQGLWRLAAQVVGHLNGLGWRPNRGIEVEVSGHVGGKKLGLGTSAALTIGLLQAAAADWGLPADADWLVKQGLASHGAAQGGRGSGYDITTLAHGGLIGYRQPPPVVEPLGWPVGLHAAALWTGRPADTAAALRRGVQNDAAGMDAIGQASTQLLAALRDGKTTSVLAALSGCELAFTQLGRRHPHLVPNEAHELAAVIRDHGALCRTSGAGGGDCVLAFADDEGIIDRTAAQWFQRGGHCVARMPADIQWTRAS